MRLDDGLLEHKQPVPFEFVGLARQLWRKVEAEDRVCAEGLDRVEAILLRRLTRKPSLRPEHVVEIERIWRAMPHRFRFGPTEYQPPRKRLHIRELRLISHISRAKSWAPESPSEPGLGVFLITCEVSKRGGYTFGSVPFATISLHALARRFQRGRDRSEAAVLRDINDLVKAMSTHGPWADCRFTVGSGEWRGVRATTAQHDQNGEAIPERPSLAIRTFIDADDIADAGR
jgi:hypothetical protein